MGTEARTRLALGALLVVTLLSFGQVFDRGEYPGPVLLGMVAAGAITAGARRLGMPTWATFAASAAALVWYVALIFQARRTFYGLPTFDALTGIGRSIQRAYDASLVDYAPAPVRPGYVLLTVAALWLATTIGEVATFRWRRPLVAVLPTIGLFSFLSVVGTRAGTTLIVVAYLVALLTFWATESSHRMRSWGRWIAGIGGVGQIEAAEVSGRLARRMGASCLAAALVAPVFLPALGDGLLTWRSGQGSGAGGVGVGGNASEIDLLASLQPTLLEQSDQELFRVRADRPSYWRLASLVTFDEIAWRPLEGAGREQAIDGIITSEGRAAVNRPNRQVFAITGLEGEFMPAAVQATEVEIIDDSGSRKIEDLLYDFQTGALVMREGLGEGFSYAVTSHVPDLTYRKLRRATEVPTDSIYTQVPDLSPEVEALLARWTDPFENRIDKLLAIQNRLRGFNYSLDVEPIATNDYLTQFLTETRVGYCQQFAASFALLARSLGFPARVSVGFLPGETDVANPNEYLVRGTQAHSWPEVHLGQYGWVAFEPTPGNQAAPPRYTVPPAPPFNPQNPFSDAVGGGGNNPAGLAGNQPVPGGRGLREGAEVTRLRTRPDRYPWQETFGNVLTVLFLLVLLFICAVPLLKELRTRLAYRRARGPVETVVAAFRDFERETAELASRRAPAESASRFAGRMGSSYKVPTTAATRLAMIYERAVYGPLGVEAPLAAEARQQAELLKRSLWHSASWWQRAKRLFSPAALLSR